MTKALSSFRTFYEFVVSWKAPIGELDDQSCHSLFWVHHCSGGPVFVDLIKLFQ